MKIHELLEGGVDTNYADTTAPNPHRTVLQSINIVSTNIEFNITRNLDKETAMRTVEFHLRTALRMGYINQRAYDLTVREMRSTMSQVPDSDWQTILIQLLNSIKSDGSTGNAPRYLTQLGRNE